MNVYELASPNQSNQERLVTEALAESQMPEDMVRQIRPPLPQIDPFPPREGWPTYAQRQPGIDGVLDTRRLYGDWQAPTSGGVGSYSGTTRNSQESGNW